MYPQQPQRPAFPPPRPVPSPAGPDLARRRRRRIAVGVVTALAAIGTGAALLVAGTRDGSAVTTTITRFAEAMDRGDLPMAVSMMCDEEAQAVLDDEDYDPEAARSAEPDRPPRREIRDIQVEGASATAVVVIEGVDQRVTLRKEQDRWVLCNL